MATLPTAGSTLALRLVVLFRLRACEKGAEGRGRQNLELEGTVPPSGSTIRRYEVLRTDKKYIVPNLPCRPLLPCLHFTSGALNAPCRACLPVSNRPNPPVQLPADPRPISGATTFPPGAPVLSHLPLHPGPYRVRCSFPASSTSGFTSLTHPRRHVSRRPARPIQYEYVHTTKSPVCGQLSTYLLPTYVLLHIRRGLCM